MNTKKMQVLYIEQTGHILAAVTRTAAAESLFDVKALAGTDLLVRNAEFKLGTPPSPPPSGEIFSVPMDLLKAEIVDLNENAFVMPSNFMVGGGQANDLRGAPQLSPPSNSLTSTSITIDSGSTVSEETKVWAQVQEKTPLPDSEPIRRIVAGIITPAVPSGSDGHTVTLKLRVRPDEQPTPIPTSSSKQYSILVLIAGRPPGFFTA